jgi:hypothetical protein
LISACACDASGQTKSSNRASCFAFTDPPS